jgi:glycerol kinase
VKKYILSLDQGTTSSRAILFEKDGTVKSLVQREIPQIFPKEGWVEHDPMTIWSTQISAATEALLKIDASWDEVYGIGITNQRETTIVWDRKTGEPIYNAIVWQCRRTADYCNDLKADGLGDIIKSKTGLLLDPYFSASKLHWILENVSGSKEKADKGELCFGTVDSWLIWKLTGGKVHATDYTNASRTMLFNINTLSWDNELLDIFGIPRSMLPEVLPSSHLFGYTDKNILGAELPIAGVAGDQQASLFGQCCYQKGDIKNTYGTGAFMLMNTDKKPLFTDNGLITTIAWNIKGKTTYALEGSVFSCGSAIQWLRDGLKIIENAQDSEYYARKVPDTAGVIVVPAFQGLGAPWWDPYARGTIIGLTRATNKYHIIRATLESLAYQTADVIELMRTSSSLDTNTLKVDGGASANSLLMEFQADILGIPIERPSCIETTALGAAYLCGLELGVYKSVDEINENRNIDKIFTPMMNDEERKAKRYLWNKAVKRSLQWDE